MMASVTAQRDFEKFGDCLKLTTPYSASFVEELKASFRVSERAWVPDQRVWVVSPTAQNMEVALRLLLGHFTVVSVVIQDDDGHQAYRRSGESQDDWIRMMQEKVSGLVPWPARGRVLSAETVEVVRSLGSRQQAGRTGPDPDSSLIDF